MLILIVLIRQSVIENVSVMFLLSTLGMHRKVSFYKAELNSFALF